MFRQGIIPHLGRIVLGLIIILMGLKLRQIDSEADTIISDLCASDKPGIFCGLTGFALKTLGLGGLWSIFVIIGVFFLAIYDWICLIGPHWAVRGEC